MRHDYYACYVLLKKKTIISGNGPLDAPNNKFCHTDIWLEDSNCSLANVNADTLRCGAILFTLVLNKDAEHSLWTNTIPPPGQYGNLHTVRACEINAQMKRLCMSTVQWGN